MPYLLHHLHLLCSNMERTEKFFMDAFGARLVERRKFGTADGAVLDLNGIKINLRKRAENEEVMGDVSQTRYGYHHLGLQVKDLDAAYQDLKRKGVLFTIPPREGHAGRMAFLVGPDNITIELFQPAS